MSSMGLAVVAGCGVLEPTSAVRHFDATYRMIACDGRDPSQGCAYFSTAAAQRTLDSATVTFHKSGTAHVEFWVTATHNSCTVSGSTPGVECVFTAVVVETGDGAYEVHGSTIEVEPSFVPASRSPKLRITKVNTSYGSGPAPLLIMEYGGTTNQYVWVFQRAGA